MDLSPDEEIAPYIRSVGLALRPLPLDEEPPPLVREATFALADALLDADLVVVEGDSGVGKTALVGSLAWAIADRSRRVPVALRKRRVLLTDSSRLMQDTRYHMYLEGRIGELARIAFAENAVICLDDLPRAATAGAHSSDPRGSVLGLILPFLGSGLKLVGTATPSEMDYLRARMPDALERARVLRLPAAEEEETIGLLLAAARDEGRELAKEAATKLHAACARFLPRRRMPGAAFDVLRESLVRGGVSDAAIAAGLRARTGLAPEIVDDSIPLTLESLRRLLGDELLGQPKAIEIVAEKLLFLKAGMVPAGQLTAALLILGPPGVGKTQLAKSVARVMHGTDRLARFDLSEYSTEDAAERLLAPGRLSAAADRGPSVVLLDEVEKAHPRVLMLLLQLLGEARLTSLDGRTADFTGSIVMMTSNLLSDRYRSKPATLLSGRQANLEPGVMRAALAARIPPELLSRVEVVPMRSLTAGVVRSIAEREVARLSQMPALASRSTEVRVTEKLWRRLEAQGYQPGLGARPMLFAVRRLVGAPVARAVAENPSVRRCSLTVDVDGSVRVVRHRKRMGGAASRPSRSTPGVRKGYRPAATDQKPR